jgi:hypothetical protein
MLPIIIDGTDFSSAVIVDSVEEIAELQEGIAARRLQSGSDWYNVIGTKLTRTINVYRNMNGSSALWNEFYNVLISPVNEHYVTIGTLSYSAHIVSVTRMMKDFVNGAEVWGDSYSVSFVPTVLNGGVA